jgi:Domain of unknown function (DUF4835)
MKKVLLFLLMTVSATIWGQEMNFTVKVLTPQRQTVDPKVFQSLEIALKDYINNQKWTDDIYDIQERITGNVQITITEELSATTFKAEIAITVFGADYSTPLLIHLDKELTFSYEQYQPLQYTKSVFTDNLTATFAYYMYSLLGMDYDSFSPMGGDTYWQTAQDIVNGIPNDLKTEWVGKDAGNRTRSWLVENNLSPRGRPYRQAMYEYHRTGLDIAAANSEACKTAIINALAKLEGVAAAYPNTLILRTFANTKGDEMIQIFKNGSSEQKAKFLQIMAKIDPASTKYIQIGGY